MTREDVMQAACRWIDTPYRPRGRGPGGLDCLGLGVMLAREFNIPHVDHLDYEMWPNAQMRILRELEKHLLTMPTDGPFDGGIGLFTDQMFPCHVGIFTRRHGAQHLVHARLDQRLVIEEPWVPAQSTFRLIRLFMLPGMEL